MNQERIYQVIVAPHVSEKAAMAAGSNSHVFKVAVNANKREIKAAVEQLFDVQVNAVQVVSVKGKQKRFGQRMGQRKDWKKAVVRLAAGQEIDFGALGGNA